MQPPEQGTYNPYYQRYIALVPQGDFPAVFETNTKVIADFFEGIGPDKHNYRYAPEKWTVKQVLLHLTDTERVMAYRALVAARGDNSTPLPAMDEDAYAAATNPAERSMEDMVAEFRAVRAASGHLLFSLSEEDTKRSCNMPGHHTSINALAYIIVGHSLHHMNVVQERYL